ncbi:MAG: site-2 protease family protein [Methanobrevibacter sp.]|uniref:site-2 protease family protein n=1 Tax=Methanobrevibacter sp. TaxID=66852 RepID=UPI0026DEB1AA|nr:site-2 protease family protein [Methanobrevibacter sp.]MDO5848631.1 site-2 protease family protein [Methanobrevibacter sp.]
MNGIWYYVIAFILIWILSLTFKKQLTNHGFEIEFPVIMWKTKRLRGFINGIANLSPKFWKWFMTIGLIICYGAMVLMTYTLIQSLSTIVEAPQVSIVLPGVDMPGSTIYVPFSYGLIGLATVIIVHEFSHGILARVEKINIKSIGLLLFAVLPGAFVEPDEEELKEASRLARLRVYTAGSMANITLALIAILICSAVSTMIIPNEFSEDGISISRVIEGSPADKVLKEGMIIESIDNKSVGSSNEYLNIVANTTPHQNLSIVTDQGEYVINLDKNPSNDTRGYIGIQATKHYELNKDVSAVWGNQLPWIWFSVAELFQWIFILNIGIGLFNLLPLKPLDGGHMFEILLSYKLKEETYKPIVKAVSIILAIIIVVSIIYSFL